MTQIFPSGYLLITIGFTTNTAAPSPAWSCWPTTAKTGSPTNLATSYSAANITWNFQPSSYSTTSYKLKRCSKTPTHSLWSPPLTCSPSKPKVTINKGLRQNGDWPNCYTHATGAWRNQCLVRLIAKRFGPLNAETQARLKTATLEQLEQWADNILDAVTLEDVFKSH